MKSFLMLTLTITAFLAISGTTYADGMKFEAKLSGSQEAVFSNGDFLPGGTDTEAIGKIRVEFDKALTEVRVYIKIWNLVGDFTAAHFHCNRPGQNGTVAFGLVMPGPLELDGSKLRGILPTKTFPELTVRRLSGDRLIISQPLRLRCAMV
jgi:CHRD domain